MSLALGIVGLPNVGKSTLFTALTKRQVAIAPYPFTTIEPNVALVAVPDENLKRLAALVGPEKVTPATIEFIDIAGLVRDAHQGRGLGNKFLAKIRETNALVEVVRVFSDEKAPHPEGSVEPERDILIIAAELAAANIVKPLIYVFNTEAGQSFLPPPAYPGLVMPLKEGALDALDRLVIASFRLLDLITFYTIAGDKEVRATKVGRGANILAAAEKIHSDFKEKFIKAEVVGCQDLIAAAGWLKAREKGLIRTISRDYLVQDGDVIEFKI